MHGVGKFSLIIHTNDSKLFYTIWSFWLLSSLHMLLAHKMKCCMQYGADWMAQIWNMTKCGNNFNKKYLIDYIHIEIWYTSVQDAFLLVLIFLIFAQFKTMEHSLSMRDSLRLLMSELSPLVSIVLTHIIIFLNTSIINQDLKNYCKKHSDSWIWEMTIYGKVCKHSYLKTSCLIAFILIYNILQDMTQLFASLTKAVFLVSPGSSRVSWAL